jgi:hypothetical protein
MKGRSSDQELKHRIHQVWGGGEGHSTVLYLSNYLDKRYLIPVYYYRQQQHNPKKSKIAINSIAIAL